jgi:acyl-CoA synthetase (NDP forming)
MNIAGPDKSRARAALIAPGSIAVVGVSEDTGKLGSVVYRNVVRSGFEGPVVAVGRGGEGPDGAVIHKSLSATDGGIDMAFLAVPAAATEAALKDAVSAGVKTVIIGAAGFAESGDGALQERLVEIARRGGTRLVGPNCNGLYNAHHPLALGHNSAHAKTWAKGGVALLSHSGALFDPLMRLMRRHEAGLSFFVSTGNEADLSVLDFADLLIEETETKVIALLIDAVHDPERFVRLVRRSSELGKSIVALKLGVTSAGAQAAAAHSSRLAGDAEPYLAFLSALGVPNLRSPEALIASAALLEKYGRCPGGVAVLTTSGAGGSLVADLGQQYDMKLASYDDATRSLLEGKRIFASIGNPTDLGAFPNPDTWSEVAIAVAKDPNVSVIVAYIHSFGGASGKRMIAALADARRVSGKPVIIIAPGDVDQQDRDLYAQGDLFLMTETDAGMQAVAALAADRGSLPPAAQVRTAPKLLSLGKGPLSEAESLSVLQSYGIPVVDHAVCRDVAEALQASRRLGWPLAVKAIVPDVMHKTEGGLVRLNLRTELELIEVVQTFLPHQVLLQRMVRGDLEVLAGLAHSPDIGLSMLLGLGGIHAESLRLVEAWPVSADPALVEAKLDSSAIGRVLASHRWVHANTRELLLQALLGLRQFGLDAASEIEAVDINPIILGAGGVVAVDALIIGK